MRRQAQEYLETIKRTSSVHTTYRRQYVYREKEQLIIFHEQCYISLVDLD